MKNTFSRTVLVMFLAVLLIATCACSFTEQKSYVGSLAYNRVFKNIAQDIDLSGAGTTAEATISENDVVSVIVVVDGQSLADSYLVTGSYSSLTNYILSSEGQAASRLITAEQKDILSEFGRSGIDFGLSLSYSAVTNAIAVDVKYGDIEKIRNVLGVKSVFVAPEFKAPSTDFTVESVQTNAQGAELFDSNGMLVNTSAYRGENMVVAVIDTGVDYKHPAFQADPSAYILTEKDITSLWPYMIASTFIARNQLIPVKSTIFTNKVPYGFNYADGTPSPIPTSASYNKGFGLEHGTHVAGIIAGNNEEIRGAAPEAQILAMKVASNTSGSLPYTAILAAINDAAVLGADAMNMSYGSGCGPVTEEGAYDYLDDIYELCGKIGIAMCAATGNDGEAAYISGGSYTANPDTGVIGSPSSYTSTFSVGSYSAGRVLYLKCGNNNIQYINARTSQGEDLDFSKLDETGESAEFEYIALGLGRESDYEGKDVSGKIALVQRGEISFSEKAKTAAEHGAKGVIVYNNEKNALFRCQVDVTEIPVCSITMENGTVLASENQGKITVSRKFSYIPMSYFSSQGPVSNLDIGVDIVAPGGSIRSSVPLLYQSAEKLSTPYSVMSGTSMATPNLTAVALVVRQYLKANFPYLTNIEVQHCIYKLLMSTSDIAYNTDGTPITPRKQGSGYVNVEKALASEAYLSVTGSDKSKLNLGSDVHKEGIYTLKFNAVNMSKSEKLFDVSAIVMTETAKNGKIAGLSHVFENADVKITANNGAYSDGILTVAPESSVKITVVITIDEQDKAYMDETFENGIYVEGWSVLRSLDGGVDLSIPFIAFYGDWDALPVFEPTYIESLNGAKVQMSPVALLCGWTESMGVINVDYNYYLGTYNQQFALGSAKEPEPNEDYGAIGTASQLKTLVLSMYRNTKFCRFNLIDEAGVCFYSSQDIAKLKKAYGYSCYKAVIPQLSFNGLDASSYDSWANNQKIVLRAEAFLDDDSPADTVEFPFYIDLEAPTMCGAEITLENGRKILTLDVFDNHYVMNVCFYANGENGLVALTKTALPVYNFEKNAQNKLSYDITDMANEVSDGKIVVLFRDYALNTAQYEISLDGSAQENESSSSVTNEYGNGFALTEDSYLNTLSSVLSASASQIQTDSDDSSSEHNFTVKNGVLTAYSGPGGKIVIPDEVTSIGTKVFYATKNITEVVINEGCEIIGQNAFGFCIGLKKITLPTTLKRIENFAFCYTTSLEELDLYPCIDSLEFFGSSSLLLTGVKKLDIPDFTKTVKYSGTLSMYLQNCEEFTFRDQITNPFSVFPSMPVCKKIEIYGSLDFSSANATQDFNWLPEVEIVNFYGDQGTIGYEQLTSYDASASFACGYNFHRMNKLREVNFYGNVKALKGSVFSSCPLLEKVTFHKDLGSIGIMPFQDCPKLTGFDISDDNEYLIKDAETGIVYDKEKTRMFMPHGQWTYEGVFEVPETVTQLGDAQFGHFRSVSAEPKVTVSLGEMSYSVSVVNTTSDYTVELRGITGIKLHSGITGIPKSAFAFMKDLTSIDFNGAVIGEIDYLAFQASGIRSFEVPSSVTVLDGQAFINCSDLQTLTIPDSVQSIHAFTMAYCSSLKEIVVPACVSNAHVRTSAFNSCASLEKVTFKKARTDIKAGEFIYCSSLKEINGYKNITQINSNAFKCSGLEYFTVPSKVKAITNSAFEGCAELREITINEGCTTIGKSLFKDCTSLETVNIPTSLTNIDFVSTFENCTSLKAINFAEGNKAFASEDGVIYNGDKTELLLYPIAKDDAEYTVPETITYIPDELFKNNSFLKTITMNGVTEIGSVAFAGSAIETVNAESLKILGSGAFMEALSIKNVPTEQISQFGTMAFAGSSITNVVLRDAEMMDAEVFAYCKNIDTVKIQAECCSFDIANAFFEASYNSIFVSPENANFVSENGFLYSKNKDVLFVYTGSEENVIIAVGVKKISDKAFFGNKSVKKVVFPETLEIIGNDAFAGCDNLETVEFRSVKAPRLLNYAVDGKITYNNFGGKKLNVIHNGDRTFKTIVWASICLDTSWWPYK